MGHSSLSSTDLYISAIVKVHYSDWFTVLAASSFVCLVFDVFVVVFLKQMVKKYAGNCTREINHLNKLLPTLCDNVVLYNASIIYSIFEDKKQFCDRYF